jgi:hypothetical protein
MDNKDRLTGLLNILSDRGMISKDTANKLSKSLTPSYENIEYLFDLATGNFTSRHSAIDILMRLS